MVDAGMGIFGRETTLAGTSALATARPTMTVDEYAAFAGARPCAPAQSPAWINAWTACNHGEYAFATVEVAGTRLALPLEIVRTGACRVARSPQRGTHECILLRGDRVGRQRSGAAVDCQAPAYICHRNAPARADAR